MHPNPIKLRIRSIEVLNMFNYRLCVTNEKNHRQLLRGLNELSAECSAL